MKERLSRYYEQTNEGVPYETSSQHQYRFLEAG